MTAAPAAPKVKSLRDPAAYTVTDVRTDIQWMADDAQLASLQGGGPRLPLADRKWHRAKSGETVKGLPLTSVAYMLEQRIIVKAGQEWRIVNPPATPDPLPPVADEEEGA